jgi:raffinose/stachyose/melibiose transport system permease protein
MLGKSEYSLPPSIKKRNSRRGDLPKKVVGSYWKADLVGLMPTMALYVFLVLLPIVIAGLLSLYSWNGVGSLRFSGFANWDAFFHDPIAAHSLEVTIVLALVSWAIQTPISMALGFFIAGKQRYRTVYAALYLLPLLLSTVGIGLVWQALLDPNFGGLAWLAQNAGLSFLQQNWLGSNSLALWTIIVLIAWQFIPFHTLLYQMGRRQVPNVLYEAASIDGATKWKQFVHITLPQLRYTIVVSSTLMLVGSLTYFDMIYVLTDGGPGDTTRVLSLDMYQAAFVANTFGYASVLAVVLGVIGVVVALLLVRFTGFSSLSSQREGIA